MASLARTGRPWKWQRSEPIAPPRVISFWASPKSELIRLSSRIHSAVNPLLIRCYGGRVSPVRAEFIAGSRRGERGFATISLPRGFCSRRGGRRSAMPSQLENPMMTSLFENNNVCHDCFSHSERLCMLIRGGWRVANGEWGRRTDYSPFAIGKAAGTKPAGAGDALGRSAAMPDCPLSSEQGLENAQKTRASYWLELASIWIGVTFAWGRRRLGSGVATLAMTGNARGNGNSRSPWPSPSRVISFWASPNHRTLPHNRAAKNLDVGLKHLF